jgi:hypothetical protein
VAPDDAPTKVLPTSAPVPRPSGRSNKRGSRKTATAPPPLDSLALMDVEDGVVFASAISFISHDQCYSQGPQLQNDKETAVEKALTLSGLQHLIQRRMARVVRLMIMERDVTKQPAWLQRFQGRIRVNRRVPTVIRTRMSFHNNLSLHRGICLIIWHTWRRCCRRIPRGPWRSHPARV